MRGRCRTGRILGAVAVLGLLAGCQRPADTIFIGPPDRRASATAPDGSAGIDWSGLAATLGAHVTDDGRVDYFGIVRSGDYRRLMDVYAGIARGGPASQPGLYRTRESALACYINAHNLLAIVALAPYFGPGTVDPRRVSRLPVVPETGFVFVLDGRAATLRSIRTDFIEPLLGGDPRALLALTAGRVNDPPLRRELYTPARLNEQLADQLVRVLRGPPWCEIDYTAREVRLPPGIARYPDYYWASYLAKPNRTRDGVGFVTALLDLADPAGRAWLDRGLSYRVVCAAPSDSFNAKSLFRAYRD